MFSDLAGAFQCEVHRFIDYAIAVGVNAGEVCDELVHVGEYESYRFAYWCAISKRVRLLSRRSGLLSSMVFSDLLMVCVGGVGVEPTGRYRACYPKFPAVVWERGFKKPIRCRWTVPVVPFHPKSHAPIALSAWEAFVFVSCLGWHVDWFEVHHFARVVERD